MLAEVGNRHAAILAQAHAQHAVVAGPHEQQDIVRGRVGGPQARVADRHLQVAVALVVDDIQDLQAQCRVKSYSDPGGARKRSTNWPESTSGNSSVPTCWPTIQINTREAAKYVPTTTQRKRTVAATTLTKTARKRSNSDSLCPSCSACPTSQTVSTGTSVLESR